MPISQGYAEGQRAHMYSTLGTELDIDNDPILQTDDPRVTHLFDVIC